MGKAGWNQRRLIFQPIQIVPDYFINQAFRGLRIPIAVWAIIGLLATLCTAGILRQKASNLQRESFRLQCNMRAQVTVRFWFSALSQSCKFRLLFLK
jgi:hypothetical protein